MASSNFTWNLAPFLVSCSTFAVFVWTSNKSLSTDLVFPALSLFNLLSFPWQLFQWSLLILSKLKLPLVD